MLITPGPLLIVPNERGDCYWLRASVGLDKRGLPKDGCAVATVWTKWPHRETAAGNAVTMAHVEELIRLLRQFRAAVNKAQLAAAHAEYDQLEIMMGNALAALTEAGEAS